jgi:penicillin-binding protein 2
MFERRLKVLLIILFALTATLMVRAAWLQVASASHWRAQAELTMTRQSLVETSRGRILDFKGRVMAEDSACTDAAVDYRVILPEPDETYIRDLARQRLRNQRLDEWRGAGTDGRRRMLEVEVANVLDEVRAMWKRLADVSGMSQEEIEETRAGIVRRVEMRRRAVWYRKYEDAVAEHKRREPSAWWKRWLIDDTQRAPELDDFKIEVAEQREAHVILRNIPQAVHNELWREIDRYPGLVLRPSMSRIYPYDDTAAHVIGTLSKVRREDLQSDPSIGNPLRQYLPNDLIGRSGLERLAEQQLRGTRGSIDRYLDAERRIVDSRDALPGADVRSTIDMELQRSITEAFLHVRIRNPDGSIDTVPMHGGAVIIDVKTGEVRAMVSFPTFDLNTYDQEYSKLARDELNRPLMNRATMFALEPGSTLKVAAGLAAIADGVVGVNEGIECTGYLQLGGRTFHVGKCWVATRFESRLGRGGVAHHPIPIPHQGKFGNRDGFLSFSEALERSCNIYFETVADRLGLERLGMWYDRLGIGRTTGVGITEAAGINPADYTGPASVRRYTTWVAGIGQGEIATTPLQMANLAATVARDGIWLKPKLLAGADVPDPTPNIPTRVDLGIPLDALRAARRGMTDVVHSAAGTGTEIRRDDMLIAGKTGTAQASKLTIIQRDEAGNPLRDEDGKIRRITLEPSTRGNPNPLAPWYRGTGNSGTDLAHGWYIGFAPADNPTIAFAVMVEYGGSGGYSAASVLRDALEACVEHGYLPVTGKRAQLLYDVPVAHR